MKAMVLAAGTGSRLMPLTSKIPKPLVSIGNRPLMEYIIELLQQHGFTDVIANLHHHAGQIKDNFGTGGRFGLSMTYSEEKELQGTAGGIKLCERFFDDTFMVISGDALTDIDLTKLVADHKKQGALATIALKPVEDVERFGIVVLDEHRKIIRFQEKPKKKQALSNLASTGIYVFEPEIFNYIPARKKYDFGKQVFPDLVQREAPVYGSVISDFWCDVGSLEAYRQAQTDVLEGAVKIRYCGQLVNGPEGTSLIGDGTSIEEGVILKGNVIIGSGCKIGRNAVIENSIIWDKTMVGNDTVLKDCIIGSRCIVNNPLNVISGVTSGSGRVISEDISGILQKQKG